MKIVAIGVSTGGPGIIEKILTSLSHIDGALIVCMHSHPLILDSYIKRLQHLLPFPVIKIANNTPLQPGYVYFCDSIGDTTYVPATQSFRVKPNKNALYTPNINTLFTSLATIQDPHNILAIILSGIGDDGVEGLLRLKNAGAHTIASDEKSSIVYGMPKAARNSNAAQKILSLEEIITAIQKFLHVPVH